MSEMKFKEIVSLWKADKEKFVKKSTVAAYQLLIVNHLVPAFGELNDIAESVVQDFVVRKLDSGLSRKSVKDMLVVLKMILRFAVRNGYMSHHEMDVRFPYEQAPSEVTILTTGHQKRIMEYLTHNFTLMNMGIYICLCAGLRIGELCALTWNDIDMINAVIKITKTIQRIYVKDESGGHTELVIGPPKSVKSIREVPMAAELQVRIRPYKESSFGSNYILTDSMRPVEPRTYRKHYRKILETLNIPHLKFHALRHSFATRCIESNCDYKTVSALLGHSSISTTLNLYVHPDREQKQKCIEQMLSSLNR